MRTVNNAGVTSKGGFQVFYPNKPGKRHWGEGEGFIGASGPGMVAKRAPAEGRSPCPKKAFPLSLRPPSKILFG
ncbi:hypothetical protein EP01_01140 [Bdellovibrio bacteriovorus]|nr:hypothetical protein EP01_01140 [Bdellovibrio bacteriovorus]